MTLSRVDLNLFPVLDVIYRERNLTRAAEVLSLTQPTVSNALARLRRALNDELFVRSTGGMVPTPFTENIIGRVRDALQLLDASVIEGDLFDPATSERTFRISMNDYTEAIMLPSLMDELGRHAPGMSVESYHISRSELEMALSSGNLELAIDIATSANPQLCYAPLFREGYVCVVSHDHPVRGSKPSLDAYLALTHINVSSRRRGPAQVDLELSKMGLQRKIQMRSQHYLVAIDIVRHSQLALTLPGMYARQTGLRILELPIDVPPLEGHLVWHKSAEGDRANQWLRERITRLCT